MSSVEPIRPIFLFDNPRTCSQLLHRMFAAHPQLDTAKAYQWITTAATSGPERMQLRVHSSERAKAADQALQKSIKEVFGPLGMEIEKESYGVAAERLRSTIAESEAEGSKIPLVKEHVACCLKPEVMAELLQAGNVAEPPLNPTAIPDEIFTEIRRPAFLVRHPALVVPSQWRAGRTGFAFGADEEGFKFFTMQRSTRFLFDYMRNKEPILLEADDVVYRSEAVCKKLCALWGLDSAGVRFVWDKVLFDVGPQHPGARDFFGTLNNSTAPIRPIEKAVDIDAEYANWKADYGADVAGELRKRVEADMADYEYLQQFRLRV